LKSVEEWKDVVGYEGLYRISNTGFVAKADGCFLKQTVNPQGYPTVGLFIEGGRKTARVHRLVAEAFLENPGKLPQVNHKDGDKENSELFNLEWCTQSHNTIHAHRNGLMKNSKPVVRECCDTGHKTYFKSVGQAVSLGYGAHTSIVRRCKKKVIGPYRGAIWTFGGCDLNPDDEMHLYVGSGTTKIHKGKSSITLTDDEINELFRKTVNHRLELNKPTSQSANERGEG
jgi:hypothetical protein